MKTPPPLPSRFVPPPVIKPATAINWRKSHLIIGILGLTALILLLLIVLFSTGTLGSKKAEWQKPFTVEYNGTNFSLLFKTASYQENPWADAEGKIWLNVFFSYKNLGPREGHFSPEAGTFEAITDNGHIYSSVLNPYGPEVSLLSFVEYGGKINATLENCAISFCVQKGEKVRSLRFLRDKREVFVMALPEPPLLVADKPGTTVR